MQVVSDYTIADAVKYEYVDEIGKAIIDNKDAGFTTDSPWVSSVIVSAYNGSDYLHDGNNGVDANKWAKWTPNITNAGVYRVYMKWTTSDNRPVVAPLEIKSADGLDISKIINQKQNGNVWYYIGDNNFTAGSSNYIKILANCDGVTIADVVIIFQYVESKYLW